MSTKTFEDFLEDKHMEGYTGIKDNAETSLDNWLSNLDVQEVIDYAEEWGKEMVDEMILDHKEDITRVEYLGH